MPHKHKRKHGDDESIFDLPPTSRAKPLLARPNKRTKDTPKKSNTRPQKDGRTSAVSNYISDDTPKAFARLMALQKTGQRMPSGLDDGNAKPAGKKRKRVEEAVKPDSLPSKKETNTASSVVAKAEIPKILPGESLREFSSRVDASLPLASISKSNSTSRAVAKELGLKQKTTRHNKRLQKMIAGWREEDVKIKEKEREREVEAELEEDEDEDGTKKETKQLWEATRLADKDTKGKKLRAKKRRNAARGADAVSDSDDDGDPWKKLNAKKIAETKQKNLQDVAQAPPTLKNPGAKFKIIENIPKAGTGHGPTSLRRREELAKERERFLAEWRKTKGLKA